MFYGWVNVAVLWLGYAMIVIPAYYGFGSLIGPLSEGLGVTMTQASLGFTIFMFTMGLSNPIVAMFLNRFGSRLTVVVGACIVVVGGLLMGSLINNIILYYLVFGLLMGFGAALTAPVPIQTNVSFWFVRTRATAMAIAITGGGFGALIFSPLLAKIASGSSSWHTPWLYVALIAGIGGIIVLAFLRNKPSDMGLLPDGDKPGEAVQGVKGAVKKTRVYKTTDNWEPSSAFRTPVFYLILIGAITVIYSSGSVIGLAVTYFTGVGIAKVLAAAAIGLFGAISIFGRLLSGVLCDRIEPRFVFAVGFLIQVAAMAIMITARSVPMVYAFVILYGISFGLTYICMPNLIVNYFGVKNFATINSVLMTFAMGIGATAPFITGLIYEATKSFTYGWYVVLLLSAVSCILALFAVPPKKNINVSESVQG